jgi:co-chaperonin GroES (HSP10)
MTVKRNNNLNHAVMQHLKEQKDQAGKKFLLVGDCILVGRVPKRELKTAGGIVLSRGGVRQNNAFDSNLPQFVQVLAVGEGYYDNEKNESIPLDLKPGNIIEVAAHAVRWFSSFGVVPDSEDSGTGVGITRESEYRMKFESYEDYETFMAPFYDIDLKAKFHDKVEAKG